MTVIVTGADGFIGGAWCAHARAAGRPLQRWIHAAGAPQATDALANGSIGSPGVTATIDLETATHDALVAALAGARAVVHLAGRAHVVDRPDRDGADQSSPDSVMRGPNVETTARLARAAVRAGAERFVFASSIKVHGESTVRGRPFRSDDRPAPEDAYARSKAAAEAALIGAAAGTSMQPVILRLPMVYGRGAKGNFRRLVEAVARGRWLPLASIDNRRSLLSLSNLLEALDAALDAPAAAPQWHLVADADSVSTPQLVRAIAAALDVGARLLPCPVALLRLIGTATNRAGAVARLTNSLEADTTSFTAWTGWRARPFAIDRAAVGEGGRVQSSR